jgi:anti-anti-sigma factor
MKSYTIERNGSDCRIVLAADLGASILDDLRADLKGQLDQGALNVAFDLGKTTVLDSSGIGLMIATHNSLARRQGRLAVTHVSPEVFQLLTSMRLIERLNVSERPA